MKKFVQGITDFKYIIRENVFYVDKTKYIEMVENDSPYLMFIRPRRFGKSLFVNMLCRYYDINEKENFSELFGNLYIGQHPTPERGSYLILYFNFSAVKPLEDFSALEQSFQAHCRSQLNGFLDSYGHLFGDALAQELAGVNAPEERLAIIARRASRNNLPIYVVIDEYDNFANNMLSAECNGHGRYQELTHGTSFFRSFFTFLKSCTGNDQASAIKRIFMTGVSPLVLDDVTSGFNIARNISTSPEYNAMLGFSEWEVRSALQEIQEARGFEGTLDDHLATMREYYDNYCFNTRMQNQRIFNTNMCLHYLCALAKSGYAPEQLLDSNTRTDYGKLHHLIVLNNHLNGNFNVLCQLAVEQSIAAELVDRFPLEQLTNKDQFVSLLFYMGILTIDKPFLGKTLFSIPNRTVREILLSYLQSSLQEVDGRALDTDDFQELAVGMATHGKWRDMLEYIHDNIVATTSIRDFIEGERAIQIAHLVALWPMKCYLPRTEREAAKGYLDLVLTPNRTNSDGVNYSYIIEFKYLSEKSSHADLEKAVTNAKAQLDNYLSDNTIRNQCAGTTIIPIVLVYKLWDIVYCEAQDTPQ